MQLPKDQDDALHQLRGMCKLWPELPKLEEVHPLAISVEDKSVLLCLHDTANDCSHEVWFPCKNGPVDLLDTENERIKPEVVVHCEQYLAATYN